MARLPRFFVPHHPLHIIQRGNNRAPIFVEDHDYQFCLSCLKDATERHGLQIHAYVLMTNHLHLLATPLSRESIPKVMQSLGRRYVRYFNCTYQRTGTLWEGRYRATLIDTDEYLLTCYRYIELNPVRANMTGRPGEYPWSSFRHNAGGEPDPLITSHSKFLELGYNADDRRNNYRSLFEAQIPAPELEKIRAATNKARVLGDDSFKRKIQAHALQQVEKRGRGHQRHGHKQAGSADVYVNTLST